MLSGLPLSFVFVPTRTVRQTRIADWVLYLGRLFGSFETQRDGPDLYSRLFVHCAGVGPHGSLWFRPFCRRGCQSSRAGDRSVHDLGRFLLAAPEIHPTGTTWTGYLDRYDGGSLFRVGVEPGGRAVTGPHESQSRTRLVFAEWVGMFLFRPVDATSIQGTQETTLKRKRTNIDQTHNTTTTTTTREY